MKSLPQTETTSGALLWASAASMPSYGIRKAWTRSGWMRSSRARNERAARGMVRGPSHCLITVRRPRVRAEEGAGAALGFFIPLKATGTLYSPLTGKSSEQAKVEARWTSSPRSTK